ncbi:MAG: glycosyltransferase family 39 protein [Fibromonadales bacterium]|nr:glycosyltransferase family 39 protein [Fibromonadales bacterium]
MKKNLREPLLYLLPLLAIMYFIVIPGQMEISDTKITRNNRTENIKLPYSVKMEANEVFFISFKLYVKNNKSAQFNVIPDDCIEEILINGEKFPLDGINGLCDYSRGAYIDFSKYTQKGLNDFEFRIINKGFPGGLRLEMPYNGFKSLSILHYVFTLFLLFYIFLILRKLKFKFIVSTIILLGISVRLAVYVYMGPMQSPFDVIEHLEHIQIVANEKRLPEINECWECHQPPLYYIMFATIKNVTDLYNSALTSRFFQQVHLLFSFASIILGVALIINLFGNNRLAYLAALISVLWPGLVIAGPRINNDIFFYFGALFCMFFAQRYWLLHRNSDVLLASIGASIALAAKTTGYVVLAVWIIVYALSVIRSLKISSLRTLFASILIIALFAGFSNHRTIIKLFEGRGVALLETSNVHSGLRVENKVGNYIYFDIEDYLLVPYTSAWTDKGGRQYFWNYLLKSSLYLHGETKFETLPVGRIIATGLNVCVLLIFVLALWGVIHVKIKELPALLFLLFLLAALICFRISYPNACNNEFRYIAPMIFPLAYFSLRGAQILLNSRIRRLAYMALLSFAGLSIVFIFGRAI